MISCRLTEAETNEVNKTNVAHGPTFVNQVFVPTSCGVASVVPLARNHKSADVPVAYTAQHTQRQ